MTPPGHVLPVGAETRTAGPPTVGPGEAARDARPDAAGSGARASASRAAARSRRRLATALRPGPPLLAAVALAGALAPASAQADDATVRAIGDRFVLQEDAALAANAQQAIRGLRGRWLTANVPRVLRSANRRVRPASRGALDDVPSDYENGFRFDSGDSDTDKWYPQGITGTGDATASGRWRGRRALLTSWYAKGGDDTVAPGVRVTFNSAERLRSSRYRHALLVVPYARGGQANFDWVDSHAGGIAWVGRWLYVAQTGTGLRVFDMQNIKQVRTGDKSRLGCDARECHAADYRYVIPQVARYDQPSGQGLRFSSVSVDRSGGRVRLVTSEFREDQGGGRIVRWEIDPRSGRLIASGGAARSSGAWETSAEDVQGAAMRGDRLFLSTSYGRGVPFTQWGARRRFYRGTTTSGRLREGPWPRGAQDLTYAPGRDRLYTVTEFPGARSVVGVDASG